MLFTKKKNGKLRICRNANQENKFSLLLLEDPVANVACFNIRRAKNLSSNYPT